MKSGASLSIGVDHENYRHAVSPLPGLVRDALCLDLELSVFDCRHWRSSVKSA